MKQKLFSLLTLLVLCVTGAWATDWTIASTDFTLTDGVYEYTFNETKLKSYGKIYVEVPSASISGEVGWKGTGDQDRYVYIYKTNGTEKDETRGMKMTKGTYSEVEYTSDDILTQDGKYYLVFSCGDVDWKASGVKYTAVAATAHTVTFNAGSNGTCGTTSLTEASAGGGVTLPAVTPYSGYAFNGWYTSAGAFAGVASATYKPASDITLNAQYLGDATFSPVSASAIDGNSTVTVTSTGATAIKYAWTETESAPAEYESAEATDGAAGITAPNVTGTRYLYVKGAKENGNDGNVMHASYTITHVQVAAGLAYAKTAVNKVAGAAAFTNPITNPNSLTVTYAITDNGTGSTINTSTGEVAVGSNAGTETITATTASSDDYLSGEATYTLTVKKLTTVSSHMWNFSEDAWAEITGSENAIGGNTIIDNMELIAKSTSDAASYIYTQSSAQSFSDGFSSKAYLNYGAVSTGQRQIHIKVAGESKISVYTKAGGSGRKIKVSKGDVDHADLIGVETEASTSATIYPFVYTSAEATDVYIWNSGSNSLYIYGIKVEPLAPSITTQPTGANYEKDDTPTALAVVAAAANGGALSYQWYSNTSETTEGATAITDETSASYTPSTSAEGTTYYYCVVSEAGVTASATSNIVAVSVVRLEGTAIIKATLTSKNAATVTGSVGGTAEVNLQDGGTTGGYKFGGQNHRVVITLAGEKTFKEGDIINIHMTKAADNGVMQIYDGTGSGKTVVYEETTTGVVGDNFFTLPDAAEGKTTLAIIRTNADDSHKWNAYVDYIEAFRPLTSIDLNASGYATFCGYARFSVSDATAYKAALNAEGTTLNLTELNRVIPAGTAVILKGTANSTATISYTTYAAEANIDGNILQGTTARTLLSSLQTQANFYAFDKTANVFKIYNGMYFPAGKAYFETGDDLAPSIIRVVDEENNATNLENLDSTEKAQKFFENGQLFILKNGITYDLLGRIVK